MTNVDKKCYVPKLRFSGFQKEWKVEKLGNVGKVAMCKRVLKEQTASKGDVPFYKIGTFGKKSDAYISRKMFELYKEKFSFPKVGDILISASGTIGRLVVFDGVDGYFQDSNIVWIDNNEELVSNSFLFYCYENIKWVTDDNTIARLYNDNLKGMKICIPSQKAEQKKVANCLTSIDDLISAHTKKLDTLNAHKKGLMQQLFPAEGKIVPKLRFSEFSNGGSWEKRTFSTLFEIGGGKDHKHLPDGDIPVYGSGGYMRSVNTFLYDGESACIGRKGTINKPMFLESKFWTVDTLFYTHTFKDCSPKFVYLLFQNINWLKLNEAGGVPSLSKVIINKVKVRVPSIDEQNAIVETIWSIDRLIYEQEQKITTLKNHKKGLMQKLFPAVNKEHNS